MILWKTEFVSFAPKQQTGKFTKNYTSVGPVLTSAGKAGVIQFKVAINCKEPELKARVSKKKNLIKAKLIELMSSKKAEKIIEERDYGALRPYMTKEINKILKGDRIEEVYFSELVTYKNDF